MLGGLEVHGPEIAITSFESKRAAALLGRVALRVGRAIPRSALIGELWPDEFEDAARPRLRQELFRLKRSLGEAEEMLDVGRETIGLDWQRVSTDLSEFQLLTGAKQIAGFENRIEQLQIAVSLARGELMPGLADPWAETERIATKQAHRDALLELGSLLAEKGNLAEAVIHVREAVRQDPLNEAAHVALVRFLCQVGDIGAAREVCRSFEYRLWNDLGLQPSSELREALESTPAVQGSPKPPPAPEADTSPLPEALNPFFGREAELAQLQALMLPGQPLGPRLVTILGMGGLGKTRLAIEAAKNLTPDFDDRVTFVSLAEVKDGNLVAPTIAKALGAAPTSLGDPYTAIRQFLKGRAHLLLLDNFEQLAPSGVGAVKKLLSENATLRAIVTSRKSLGLMGEQIFPIEPLITPEVPGTVEQITTFPSVALFVDQAKRVNPRFEIDAAAASAILKIARVLEGIPLAILMAASRTKVLTPQQMLDELENRLRFLVTSALDVEDRHRTMRGAIAWSCDLLPEPARKFFFRLSVFRGGWTYEAARAILNEPQTLDYLELLQENSLIEQRSSGGHARFQMFESVREYGAEQLSDDEKREIGERHAEYFQRTAAEARRLLGTETLAECFRTYTEDGANIRAALEWCIDHDAEAAMRLGEALAAYAVRVGRHVEAQSWIERLAAIERSATPNKHLSALLFYRGLFCADQANFAESRKYLELARAASGSLGNEPGVLWADLNLAWLDELQEDYAHALETTSDTVEAFRRVDAREGLAHALGDLASLHVALGRFEEAAPLLDESRAIREELGRGYGFAHIFLKTGSMLIDKGELDLAEPELLRSYAESHRTREIRLLSDALGELIELALLTGKPDRARKYLEESETLRSRMADLRGLAQLRGFSARLSLLERDPEGALAYAREALDRYDSLDSRMGKLDALETVAEALLMRGEAQKARQVHHAVAEYRAEHSVLLTPRAMRRRRELASRISSEADASPHCKPALEDLDAIAAFALGQAGLDHADA